MLPDITPALSASFLGAAVLELTGRGEESPWFSFLNQLRREVPVVQKNALLSGNTWLFQEELDAGGEDQALAERIAKWRRWSYYKLRYQEFPA